MPEYNYRMCQNDIISMGTQGKKLVFDNPAGYSEFDFSFASPLFDFKFLAKTTCWL